MTVSHWQINPEPQEYDADFLVIGAGLTGCSAAIFAANAGRQVTITDARGLGLGASSRNAGFLLSGIDAYYHRACERYGEPTVRELWALSQRTHAHWRAWGASGQPGARIAETGTLLLAETPAEARDIELAARAMDAAGIEQHLPRARPPRAAATTPPSSATSDAAVQPMELLQSVFAQSGATLLENNEVYGIEAESGAGSRRDAVLVH